MSLRHKCANCGYRTQFARGSKNLKRPKKDLVGWICRKCGHVTTREDLGMPVRKSKKPRRKRKPVEIPDTLSPQHNWQQRYKPQPTARAALPNLLPAGVSIAKKDMRYINYIPQGSCKLTYLGRQAFWDEYPLWAPKFDLKGIFKIYTETPTKIIIEQDNMPVELPKEVKVGKGFLPTVRRSES